MNPSTLELFAAACCRRNFNHIRRIEPQGADKATAHVSCPRCHIRFAVESLDRSALLDFITARKRVQVAFPNKNASDRELLLTGTCSACWDEMFKPEDE